VGTEALNAAIAGVHARLGPNPSQRQDRGTYHQVVEVFGHRLS
jgi:hypothetical protein